jgi:hypothetical protein
MDFAEAVARAEAANAFHSSKLTRIELPTSAQADAQATRAPPTVVSRQSSGQTGPMPSLLPPQGNTGSVTTPPYQQQISASTPPASSLHSSSMHQPSTSAAAAATSREGGSESIKRHVAILKNEFDDAFKRL